APFQALEHGAEGGRKGEAGLPALHHNLERRIVLDPAPLVGQKLEGRPLSFVRCHLLVLGFQFSVVSYQLSAISLQPSADPAGSCDVILSEAKNPALVFSFVGNSARFFASLRMTSEGLRM